MTAYLNWTDFEGLHSKYSEKKVFEALVFVAETTVEQCYAQGVELPRGFDEIHEILNDIQKNKKVDLVDFSQALRAADSDFWENFSYFLLDLKDLARNVNKFGTAFTVISYAIMVSNRLAVMANILRRVPADHVEGYHIVGNLLIDRLEGRI